MNNRVELTGNVGKDPELKTTQSGIKVVTYSIGVYRANPKEKDKPFTDWFNIVAWGDQAELVMSNVKKGTKVKIDGGLRTRHYTDKDGKEVYVTEVMQNEFWLSPAKEKKVDTGSTFDDSELPF